MKSCNDTKPSKYITYLDANNVYGWAMSQYLPYSGFNWLNKKKKFDRFNVNSISENNSHGYILKFDLEYPDKLHELHNDYSLAPEKLEISRSILSKYCSDIADQYGIKVSAVNELVPNLGTKSRYVLHYRNLQMYLPLRIKLVSVHRILEFRQFDWLKKVQ